MGIFKKFFQKNNAMPKDNTNHEKFTINQIKFQSSSQQTIDDMWNKIIEGKLSEIEEERVRREICPKCKMSVLAENDIVLYRMAKSSNDIAQKSAEGWNFTEHKPNSVVQDFSNGHGFSITTAESLLMCIPYGDVMVEVVFDKNRLSENNMDNEYIYRVGETFDEYLATKFLVGNTYNLSDPCTLEKIIGLSSDDVFKKMLITPRENNFSINYALEKFGLSNTLTYWEMVCGRYNQLVNSGCDNPIRELRNELNDILQKTLFMGNEVLNGEEKHNITPSFENIEHEI